LCNSGASQRGAPQKGEKMLTKEQFEEFKELCDPLFQFLAENCNPHQSIIIDNDYARIVSDEVGTPNKFSDR